MNPVFVFLVILAGILLWFLLGGLFKIIGIITNGLIDNAKNNMMNEKEIEENE